MDELTDNDRAVWLNALFFKGLWKSKFNKTSTKFKSFTKTNGEKVTVMMMTHDGIGINAIVDMINIKPEEKYQYDPDNFIKTGYATMDYGNGAFALTAIIPDTKIPLLQFISDLSSDFWDDIVNEKSKHGGSGIDFPRLSLSASADLIEPMKAIGVENVFKNVNMPGIGEDNAIVSQFKQDIRLDIEEEGSEFKVVTTAVGGDMVFIRERIDFNRPFLYFIWEKSTGTILLAGTVMNPTE